MKNKKIAFKSSLYAVSFVVGILIATLLLKYVGFLGIFIFLGMLAMVDFLMFRYMFEMPHSITVH